MVDQDKLRKCVEIANLKISVSIAINQLRDIEDAALQLEADWGTQVNSLILPMRSAIGRLNMIHIDLGIAYQDLLKEIIDNVEVPDNESQHTPQ